MTKSSDSSDSQGSQAFGLPQSASEPAARKQSTDENFPVASRLLPKALRPHVMAFYGFVRLADDIADDPILEPEVKLAHLDVLERSLTGETPRRFELARPVTLRAEIVQQRRAELHNVVGYVAEHARQSRVPAGVPP